MMRHTKLEPRFVTTIPNELEEGVLYVSMEYGTVVHSCCCGCGHEVVTPLTPTDWLLTFNGEAVSLWPSVGSWNLPCQSHYVIKGNRVVEAGPWSRKMVEKEVKRDKAAKTRYYASVSQPSVEMDISKAKPSPAQESQATDLSLWKRLFGWLWKYRLTFKSEPPCAAIKDRSHQ